MSLGAIDFGLIVDGAVIIVENAVRRLAEARGEGQQRLDAGASGSDVVRDATRRGRERQRVRRGDHRHRLLADPRAARASRGSCSSRWRGRCSSRSLGAFVLSLTLVPVLASYFLRPAGERARDLADARRRARGTSRCSASRCSGRPSRSASAWSCWRCGGGLRTRLGAEFVPQLDEGDLLARGAPPPRHRARPRPSRRTSASQRGAAGDARGRARGGHAPARRRSRPTRWASSRATSTSRSSRGAGGGRGSTKEALAREMAEAVERAVPEVGGRGLAADPDAHNELIAGVRSDVAVAASTAPTSTSSAGPATQIAAALGGLPGVVDVRAEQTAGLTLPPHHARPRAARALRPHRRGRRTW